MRISDWSSDVCSSDLAGNLGEALCGIRHLLDEEPFALFVTGDTGGGLEEDVTARLLASYYDHDGNLVAVGDDAVLQRGGSFAVIVAAKAGHYVLQPAVHEALEVCHGAGLAAKGREAGRGSV